MLSVPSTFPMASVAAGWIINQQMYKEAGGHNVLGLFRK